jgi:hypothetical protein
MPSKTITYDAKDHAATLDALLRDAARYRHLRDHYLRSCAHPLGDAIGMDEVIFGVDADSAIDADIKRRAGDE